MCRKNRSDTEQQFETNTYSEIFHFDYVSNQIMFTAWISRFNSNTNPPSIYVMWFCWIANHDLHATFKCWISTIYTSYHISCIFVVMFQIATGNIRKKCLNHAFGANSNIATKLVITNEWIISFETRYTRLAAAKSHYRSRTPFRHAWFWFYQAFVMRVNVLNLNLPPSCHLNAMSKSANKLYLFEG